MANKKTVVFYGVAVHYSYSTVVAFEYKGRCYTSENLWGVTTGRHINELGCGTKAERLPWNAFEKKLKDTLSRALLVSAKV